MPIIPVLKAAEVIRILQNLGFRIIRSKGSHFRLEHIFSKRHVTVSFHSGNVPRKTLRSILQQANITLDTFLRYLRKK